MGDNYKYDSQGWEAYKKGRAKSTTCDKCNAPLTGKRTRFCSDHCSSEYDQERSRRKYELFIKINLEDRICLACNKKYSPRTKRQEVCSKTCRTLLTNKQRKEKKENRISGVERLVKKNAFLQQIPLER